MTSSNENIFRITGLLWVEFTGHRWITLTKASGGALMFSLICAWINGSVNNCEAGDLRCHFTHYVVTVVYIIASLGHCDITVTLHEHLGISNHQQLIFVQQLVETNNKGHIKAPHYWLLVKGIHQWPDESPHKWPVLNKVSPCQDIIMEIIFSQEYFCRILP